MNGDESMMNCSSSAINGDPVPAKSSGSLAPMFKSLSGGSCYYGSGWDPIVSLNHGETFGGSSNISSHCDFPYPVVMENQGTGNNTSSHLAQYPSSDLNLVQMIPKLPCYESGNYSEMATSFGLPATTSGCPPNYFPNRDGISEKNSIDGFECQEGCQVSEEEAAEGRRRKRSPDSHPSTCHGKKSEREQHKDLSGDELSRENGGKKQKILQNTVASSNGKQSGKQATENSQSGEDPKASYVHMRARRGQATNSHSLAERVRREKISERMKMLQELVPGCNKITGKAVMLDEIINYVQSLQQQVEFLSMKLATINPELNIDIEQLISKDILHSRGGNSSILGIGPGLGSSHPHSRGFLHGTLPSFHSSGAPMFHPMPQNVWDSELQNLLQMGLISNTSIETLGINGQSKSEV